MTLVEPPHHRSSPLFGAAFAGTERDRPAVISSSETLTYGDLDKRVRAVAASLAGPRRLVMIEAANQVDTLVAYLAALREGHAALLVPAAANDSAASIEDTWAPDIVFRAGRPDADVRRRDSSHHLHPDLALLLSTSGSTGSPRLVRLSHENVDSNARAIATYLHLDEHDRAITSLPMAYCYGLSVINSHLTVGATIVLTDHSVVDPCFWRLFHESRVTNFAGVPHTFELLDRVGFDSMHVPTLRFLTQAGGRMCPTRVRRYAELGAAAGWDFYVMYGQTEATARMAYLPPHLVGSHPNTVGIAIPGGELRVDAPDSDGVGELVYRGPNVMLGYAESETDLEAGACLSELRTGDLARVTREGLYELVGRRARFIKPAGVRIDLDRIETTLRSESIDATCTGDDEGVVVAVTDATPLDAVHSALARLGIANAHRAVVVLPRLPRLVSGKPDYTAIIALARTTPCTPSDLATSVEDVFTRTFGDRSSPDATFIDLGGDSLTYIEVSIQLEALLGHLPDDWHVMPVRDLVRHRQPKPLLARAETTAVVRAAAIVFIVATHTKLWHLPGGAHALLAVAGFNFARFQLSGSRLWASIARVAVPSMAWIAVVALVGEKYGWPNVLLVHNVVERPGDHWGYWFIEALVWTLVALAVVLSAPRVRDVVVQHAFGVAVAATVVGLWLRFAVVPPESSFGTSRPLGVLWLFTIGWAGAAARDNDARLAVSALAAIGLVSYFDDPVREATIFAAILLVVWVRVVAVPRVVQPAVAALAGASLYIYLTHFQVFPPVERLAGREAAVAASLAVGILASRAARQLTEWTSARRRVRVAPSSSSNAL